MERPTADTNLQMDTVIQRRGSRHALSRELRDKSILLDITHADPQVRIHPRGGSVDRDRSAATTTFVAPKRQLGACLEKILSFDERSHKLAIFAVESFGRLRLQGIVFIDQLAASVVEQGVENQQRG